MEKYTTKYKKQGNLLGFGGLFSNTSLLSEVYGFNDSTTVHIYKHYPYLKYSGK